MASSFWSMLTCKSSSSASPKIQGNTGPSQASGGDTAMSDPIIADLDDDLFGPPVSTVPGGRTQEDRLPPLSFAPPAALQQVFSKSPMPQPKAGEVPDVYVQKVEAYIADHFYDVEARMKLMEQKMTEVVMEVQKREDQVSQVFQQVKQLIELQFAETKKGLGRDQEMLRMAEEFERLRMDAVVKQTESIAKLEAQIQGFHTQLQDYGEKVMVDVQHELRKRDDVSYKIEADFVGVKKSFSSLRLEFQKSKKGQEFKNTSTSVFLLKAIDMKPEERKRLLRTLTEQEEKNRGAIDKAENDLRAHEKELHEAS